MRLSETYLPTLAAAPRDASPASFALLLRAGLARRCGSGQVALLPLGVRALQRLEGAALEALGGARLGALELPPESRPSAAAASFLDRTIDCLGAELAVARPHRVMMWQRTRSEPGGERARFGLIGAHARPMLAAVAFDHEEAVAAAQIAEWEGGLRAFFADLGLAVKLLRDAGDRRGWYVISELGAQGVLRCSSCAAALLPDDGASLPAPPKDAATAGLRSGEGPAHETPALIATPNARTIGEVAAQLGVEQRTIVKTMILLADGDAIAVLLRGDRVVSLPRLRAALGVEELSLAPDDVVERVTGAPVGFAGPVGLALRTVADAELTTAAAVVVGANQVDAHLTGVWLERDARIEAFVAARALAVGDRCPRCAMGSLTDAAALQVAEARWLPRRFRERCGEVPAANGATVYSAALELELGRILGLVAEACADDRGLRWPASSAPAEVLVMALQVRDEAVAGAAHALYLALREAGLDAVLDDRDRPVGAKFADADLLGIPWRLAVGKKTLADGAAEFSARADGERRTVPLGDAVSTVVAACGGRAQQRGAP